MPTLWWCWGKVQGSTEDTLSGKQTSVTIFDGNPTQLLRWFKKTIKKIIRYLIDLLSRAADSPIHAKDKISKGCPSWLT